MPALSSPNRRTCYASTTTMTGKKKSAPRRPTPKHKTSKPAATTMTTAAPAAAPAPAPTRRRPPAATFAPVPIDGAEPLQIARDCPACGIKTSAVAILVRLPHWDREVAATRHSCHECRHVSTKYTVGVMPTAARGVRHTLHVRHPRDLDREMLKSEYAVLSVPKLGLQLTEEAMAGTLCTGRELLGFIRNDVAGNYARAMAEGKVEEGDDQITALRQFLEQLSALLALDVDGDEEVEDHLVAAGLATADAPFVIEIEDPAGNSYIQPLGEHDNALTVAEFDRTPEHEAKWAEHEESAFAAPEADAAVAETEAKADE
ncbi:nucleolar zinc-finger protein [Blastocladiella emersonii ATCC 22665]|nr:nucleolar zinc-finger protein [Blastocladiella emersonii ATCC 22665]